MLNESELNGNAELKENEPLGYAEQLLTSNDATSTGVDQRELSPQLPKLSRKAKRQLKNAEKNLKSDESINSDNLALATNQSAIDNPLPEGSALTEEDQKISTKSSKKSKKLGRVGSQASENQPLGVGEPLNSARKLKLYFIHSPNPLYLLNQDYGVKFMPTWAYTLQHNLKGLEDKLTTTIIDTRIDSLTKIKDADLLLFSGINQDYSEIIKSAEILKKLNPAARSIIGGPIAWSYDKAEELELLSAFDHIFVGDGETHIKPLVNLFYQSLILGLAEGSEDVVNTNLLLNTKLSLPLPKIIRNKQRYDITQASPISKEQYAPAVKRYYGAVVEISRGCPFLCEFCDIRIMLDNNKAHNKPVATIMKEIAHLDSLGVKQIILACDNIVGDPTWAKTLVAAIKAYRISNNSKVTFYTWATITIAGMDELLKDMRVAGFDLLFIGVESFNQNSLLETAKTQNSRETSLPHAIRHIQSYGFIIVSGLIVGFDWDREDVFEITARGILRSGLLTGDPSFLYALPGTPLYQRLKLAGRLRPLEDKNRSRQKITTNMEYLLDAETMKNEYLKFIMRVTSGEFNYHRLEVYFMNLALSQNYLPLQGGFGNLKLFIKNSYQSKTGRKLLTDRISFFLTPKNFKWVLKGLLLTYRQPKTPYRLQYFKFWLYSWGNMMLNNRDLKFSDIDITSLSGPLTREQILPLEYQTTHFEEIDSAKIKAQRRATVGSLEKLIKDLDLK